MSVLGEADTRAKLIDPAIHARGWTEDLIKREQSAGAITVQNGKPRRSSRGRMDYLLRVQVNPNTQPVAVALLEAKRENLPPGHGLDQAKGYARTSQHHVPFVFSSNGHLFVEFDRTTGRTTAPRPLGEFPTPADLRERYERAVQFPLTATAAKPLLTRYAGGEGQRRYFQDAAIRAVFEKVARCAEEKEPPRVLLSLATGTGKTFIAVNLLKRIADAGQLRRALFLCDREELRDQGLKAMQAAFGQDAAEVYELPDGTNHAKNARVHVATYQTLGIDKDGDASFLTRHYPNDHFSHIVIDECHRSAWGKWSAVLTRNPNAVQVGLTATPRQLKTDEDSPEARADAEVTADNLRYFGEPAYEYGMMQAMDDGYLAAYYGVLMQVNLDATGLTRGEVVLRNPTDARTGRKLTPAEVAEAYSSTDYEAKLLLPDRVRAMCHDLFSQILAADPDRGPHQKTIVFCARDAHADAVAAEMNNLYAAWCRSNQTPVRDPYAFKCTRAGGGNAHLPDLKSSSSTHFIATTVELLTTGVDVPAVRNIAFFRYVRSPITFYQMIGRGTRIDEATGKLMFRVYDYTGATRLFGSAFATEPKSEGEGGGPGPPPPPPPPPPPVVTVEGFEVHLTPLGTYVLMEINGAPTQVPVEDFRAGMSRALVRHCPDLDTFRRRWVQPSEREEVITAVVDAGYSPAVLQMLDDRTEYDLYDVLADLGYGLAPRTRQDRAFAFRYKHATWLAALPTAARTAVEAIADQFALGGTDGLENRYLMQTPEVAAAGGVAALAQAGEPKTLLTETKERMFAV